MTIFRLITATWKRDWRWQAGLALGVAIATAVITGSLGVGDSLKATLKDQASERLGQIAGVLAGQERFFTEALARQQGGVPVIAVRGSVSRADGTARANEVQLFGVTPEFFALGQSTAPAPQFSGNMAMPNAALAQALKGQSGENDAQWVIRVEKPSALSKEAPLSGEADDTLSLSVTVKETVSPAQLGNFALAQLTTLPRNLFLPLATLQSLLDQSGRVNLALNRQAFAPSSLDWTLDDIGLEATQEKDGSWQVKTSDVFLSPAIESALEKALSQPEPVFTYLVTTLKGPHSPSAVPWSMVTAASTSVPVKPGEVVISPWLADDQKLKVGDSLALSYLVMAPGRQFETRQAMATVASILPKDDPRLSPGWTPKFPGVEGAASCREFKPGMKIDLTAIRDQDEAYWKDYKGTPKAFIALPQAQELWANRFGQLTGFKTAHFDKDTVLQSIKKTLTLEQIGFPLINPAAQAAQGIGAAYDLGTLFISLGFFLILAALGLTGLLYLFQQESRSREIGLLLALGFTPAQIQRLSLSIAAGSAVIGAMIGLPLGILYTRWVLHSLNSQWSGAIGGLQLSLSAQPLTLIIGWTASIALALGIVWWLGRRMAQASPKDLVAGIPLAEASLLKGERPISSRPSRLAPWLRWSWLPCLLLAVAAFILGKKGSSLGPPAFWGIGGGMLLLGCLSLWGALKQAKIRPSQPISSVTQFSWKSIIRRPGRSLAVAILLTGGVFLISSLACFQLDPKQEAFAQRGTGGFDFLGESSLPIYENLATNAGQEVYGLEAEDLADCHWLSLRVRPGDEASCLNLQRPQSPRVLGAPLAQMEQASFEATKGAGAKTWASELATRPLDQGAIPCAMDASYVTYTLKAGLGDILETKGDDGQPVKLKLSVLLAPSIFQGYALIDEAHFLKAFPQTGGYRAFLLKAPAARQNEVTKVLSRQLSDRGLSLISAKDRLMEFSAVQNTYLGIFSALGGLALILSTLGLGLLLARHVLERRSEFGVLQACGFTRSTLKRMVVGENALLLLFGLFLGLASALAAVAPVALAHSIPWRTLVFVLIGGLIIGWLAATFALRGRLIEAIRRE